MKAAELPGLNLLRLLASLYMAMYHLGPLLPFDVLPAVLTRGSSGTSLFFILSGFLLAYLYSGKRYDDQAQRQFVWRRWARLLPANIAGLAFLLTVQGLLRHSYIDWAVLAKCLFLVQTWGVGTERAMNIPAWSMSCIMFFYLIFPVLLPRIQRLKTAQIQLMMLGLWLLSAVGFPELARWPGSFEASSWIGHLHMSPLLRSSEFILGIGLAILVRRKGMPSVWWFRFSVPLIGAILLFAPSDTMSINNGLFAPLAACLLVGFLRPGRTISHLGQHPLLRAAANSSIGIFLLHMTWIDVFSGWLLPYLHTDWNLGLVAGLLLVVTLSALLVDRWICRPVTRWLVRPTFPVITVPALRVRRPLSHAVKQPPAASA